MRDFRRVMTHLEQAPTAVGKYEILKPLATGGMGVVYLGRSQNSRGELVAIKVINPGVLRSEESRVRFGNEIVASFSIAHPNIVRAVEFVNSEGVQAYVMEYIDGGTLSDFMMRKRLTLDESLLVLMQVAFGLSAIHSQGIIHRDLKPENIFLSKEGIAKIGDFGVARATGSQTITQEGLMVGTPRYLAPEYIETGECDYRADIYALGVIAYEILSGCSPFTSTSKNSLLTEHFLKHTPLEELAPEVPKEVVDIVNKAMCISVANRYQSAEEVLRDLEKTFAVLSARYQEAEPKLQVLGEAEEASGYRFFKELAWGCLLFGVFLFILKVVSPLI